MTHSIDDKILTKIRKARRGSLFFVVDFLSMGSAKAVSKAMERARYICPPAFSLSLYR